MDSLGIHNILTTVMTNIVVAKSADNAKPYSICQFPGFRNFALIKVNGLEPPGKATKVQILDLQGHLIGEVPFKPRSTDKSVFDWLNFVPPRGLFYIRVVGRDDTENVFYRTSPTALSAMLPGLYCHLPFGQSFNP